MIMIAPTGRSNAVGIAIANWQWLITPDKHERCLVILPTNSIPEHAWHSRFNECKIIATLDASISDQEMVLEDLTHKLSSVRSESQDCVLDLRGYYGQTPVHTTISSQSILRVMHKDGVYVQATRPLTTRTRLPFFAASARPLVGASSSRGWYVYPSFQEPNSLIPANKPAVLAWIEINFGPRLGRNIRMCIAKLDRHRWLFSDMLTLSTK